MRTSICFRRILAFAGMPGLSRLTQYNKPISETPLVPPLRPAGLTALLAWLASAALAAGDARAAEPDMPALQKTIEAEIRDSGVDAGVVIHHAESGRQLAINADRSFPMASVYKLPILVEMYRRVAAGELSLDERVTLSELDRNTVNYVNEFGPGLRPTYRDLGTLMIILTDSSATDVLLRQLGSAKVTATMRSLGLPSIRVDRTVEDIIWDFLGIPNSDALKRQPYRERVRVWLTNYGSRSNPEADQAAAAYYRAERDSARPADIAKLLSLLARSKILEPRYCDEILNILYRQRLRFGLSHQLPPGTPVGSKTGHLGAVTNDAGIIKLPDGSQLIVVAMTQASLAQGKHAEKALADQNRLIGRIARLAYDAYTGTRAEAEPHASTAPAPQPSHDLLGSLHEQAKENGRRIAIDGINLATGKRISLHPDERYFMGGLADLPVLMHTLRDIERHRTSLDHRLTTSEADRQTYGDGFLREFEPGLNPTVDDLLNLLAVRADASARDMLLKRAGVKSVSQMLSELGLRNTRIERTAEDMIWDLLDVPASSRLRSQPFLERHAYFQKHFVNERSPAQDRAHQELMSGRIDGTTASDQVRLLSAIALGKFGNPSLSKVVLDRLMLRMEAVASGGQAIRLRHNAAGVSHELSLFQDNGAQLVIAVLSAPAQPKRVTPEDAANWDTPVNFSPHSHMVGEAVSRVRAYLGSAEGVTRTSSP